MRFVYFGDTFFERQTLFMLKLDKSRLPLRSTLGNSTDEFTLVIKGIFSFSGVFYGVLIAFHYLTYKLPWQVNSVWFSYGSVSKMCYVGYMSYSWFNTVTMPLDE